MLIYYFYYYSLLIIFFIIFWEVGAGYELMVVFLFVCICVLFYSLWQSVVAINVCYTCFKSVPYVKCCEVFVL